MKVVLTASTTNPGTTFEFFVQDDWKATKRLTINYGLRMSHLQPWIDRVGDGFSIFNPSQFSPSCAAEYCGFEWNKKDPSIPIGGFPTRALFYAPRVGAAYDLFGNGKTVLRGGYGRYYFHAGQATTGLDASAGVESYSFGPERPRNLDHHGALARLVTRLDQPGGLRLQSGGSRWLG